MSWWGHPEQLILRLKTNEQNQQPLYSCVSLQQLRFYAWFSLSFQYSPLPPTQLAAVTFNFLNDFFFFFPFAVHMKGFCLFLSSFFTLQEHNPICLRLCTQLVQAPSPSY